MDLLEKASRRLYAWLAFFSLFGMALSLLLTALNIDPVTVTDQTLFHQNTAPIRIVGFFSYFTIWSNILVVYVSVILARGKALSERFKVLFACGLIMITVTGLVYNLVLLPAFPPKGWYWLTSTLMHLVAPVMYIWLWVKRGPRGFIMPSKSLQILTIPIIYVIYTVVHGLAIKQWPYKFLDLTSSGVVVWSISVALIFGFGELLIIGFGKIDRKPIKKR